MKRAADQPANSPKVLRQPLTPSHHRQIQPLVDNQFVRHLFLLHTPIRLFLEKVLTSVNALTPLAPDAHLDDLNRRIVHLSNIVLSHCRIEDRTIFPVLSKASSASSASPHRTAKRARIASSPVSVDPQPIHDDHQHLGHAFDTLRSTLRELRAAPLLKPQSLPLQSPRVSSTANASPFLDPTTSSSSNPSYQTTYGPRTTNRQEGVVYVKRTAKQLADRIRDHLRNEESYALPIATSFLSHAQQRQLVLRVTNDTVSVQHLPDAFRLVPHGDLVSLLQFVSQHASDRDNKRIALTLAKVLSVSQWRAICADVPTLANMQLPKQNSLIEISHMHKAITKELNDIVAYCESIDTSNPKQMQSLSFRVSFLRRVHSYHAEGEESVLLKELHAKLSSSPDSTATNAFHDDHNDEAAMFNDFSSKLESLQDPSGYQSRETLFPQTIKQQLLESVRNLASHLKHHMEEEETKLLPLLRKYFTLADQDRMMRLVMAKVPPAFLREVIPWMFNLLDVDDQECMLRNLMRTAPPNEICKVISSIAQSVQKGMTDRMKWNEICLRVPELEGDYKSIVEKCEMDNDGPISEILRVHKAFRIELNTILRRTKEIRADGSAPNPLSLNSLMESLTFVRKMVADHSKAEDDILLPRLEAKSPGISEQYKEDHCDEAQLFQDFSDCLMHLRCATDESECTKLVQKLQLHARVLRDEMVKHLELEEKQLWPICQQQFDEKEQSEIVALIFGQIPSKRLREMLPWMIRLLSVSERNTMMNHILLVTKSTMFEKWLNSWLPLDNECAVQSDSPSKERVLSDRSLSVTDPGPSVAKAARVMLEGRENLERTMRSIAQDSSLTVQERTRMMQRIMLAPYQQRSIDRTNICKNQEADDLRKTYADVENGRKHLGCKHYRRGCKLRAACCQKLYTCRLCHDAEETHVMNRSATKEILCMECSTLQAVAAVCINEKCQRSFARYFCGICVFFDDRENAKVYHCHSCNVCRVGKGLGIDYFHCMKCNQCMHVKYREKGHNCIQKAMESDCPVCFQYMFTSTSPVKYLQCGHLMHTACYDRYRNNSIRCPICSRSLEEMTPLYQLLDQQLAATGANMMPAHYRSARCDLYCKDCFTKSNTPYHFLYNKCPVCQSYNTRVEHVDPNGDGSSKR
ncbi:Zinc finger protein BRUTUS [Gracilariopsis chorda]|uniref:Zinc finger protein BRUTUS n=1 Tax=Gracilariopsis chorda TaxID=448386 RepID=A0A2V3IR81_9FLOR|nr:Zinc finger protein BRUTUS [Gracilariopsis chorda]|eukprot:PXF44618.1 Zinc finger protein BRUTUS [Gracilariopsis chorda]